MNMNTQNDSSQPDTKLKNEIRNGVRLSNLILAVGSLLVVLNIFPLGVSHLIGYGAAILILFGSLGSRTFSAMNLLFSRLTTLETALRELQGSSRQTKDTKHNEAP